jgi:hypothetical protein
MCSTERLAWLIVVGDSDRQRDLDLNSVPERQPTGQLAASEVMNCPLLSFSGLGPWAMRNLHGEDLKKELQRAVYSQS